MTSSSTSEHTVADRLYVGFGTGPPALADLTVFARREATVAGHRLALAVIGSSHYVHAPEAGFHEILACEPIAHDTVHELPLPDGEDVHLSFDGGDLSCETTVAIRPIETFPADSAFDLEYEFGPDAHTAIAVTDRGYETYHTYPEYDSVVYSETRFEDDGSDP